MVLQLLTASKPTLRYLSVPSSSGMVLQLRTNARHITTGYAFSSLLVGNGSSTPSDKRSCPPWRSFQFPPRRELFFNTDQGRSALDNLLSVPSSSGMVLQPLSKTPKKQRLLNNQSTSLFEKPFSAQNTRRFAKPISQDIAAIIPKLTIHAPISDRCRRRHLLTFDHSPDLTDHFVRLVLPLFRQDRKPPHRFAESDRRIPLLLPADNNPPAIAHIRRAASHGSCGVFPWSS